MFDNAPLFISFGPVVDRMFIAALALIIFVYGVTAVMWLYNELDKLFSIPRLRKFLKLKPKPELEVHELVSEPESPVLYEVMWSDELEHKYAANSRRRIVADPMEGAYDLLKENDAGYIRYRVWLDEAPPWGSAKWYPALDERLVLPKFPEDYDLSTFSPGIAFPPTDKTKAEDGDPV